MARNPKTFSRKQVEKEFAVIGLGRFGGSLARRLEALGHTVLGVDIDMARVQDLADEITSAVALDATVEDALQEVDIASFSTVVIGLGSEFEASALVTTYLKGLGIPRVICQAQTRRHRDILLRIGADQVVLSDEDSGERLADTLGAPNMVERVLLDADHSLIEFKVSGSLISQPVTALGRYDVAVLLIQRSDHLIPCPSADTRLQAGDTLFAVGQRARLLEVASLP
ncbi:MAG: TrkA family potassium uptake protein [Anaerolineae bacterium]|nr:TrkA family potassium uptake protein [Anaerolineae bacterium]